MLCWDVADAVYVVAYCPRGDAAGIGHGLDDSRSLAARVNFNVFAQLQFSGSLGQKTHLQAQAYITYAQRSTTFCTFSDILDSRNFVILAV